MKAALKAGDSAKRTLIGMVLTSIRNKEIEKRTALAKTTSDAAQLDAQSQLSDEETMAVIATEVKRRKDSIAEFTNGGRPELAASEQAEIDILMPYLPEQMSDDTLRAIVQNTIADLGEPTMKDMGRIISTVMAEVKGKADGQRVSGMVKQELSK